ncbi:MAG: hypothetical protein J2P17_11725 [Mycobacterium sp.]|nr:hypothetical protein [Mycobacterium sp.]
MTGTDLARGNDQVRGLYRKRWHLIAALVRQAELESAVITAYSSRSEFARTGARGRLKARRPRTPRRNGASRYHQTVLFKP